MFISLCIRTTLDDNFYLKKGLKMRNRRKSNEDEQNTDQNKKDKSRNNDQRSTTQKIKLEQHEHHKKNHGEGRGALKDKQFLLF